MCPTPAEGTTSPESIPPSAPEIGDRVTLGDDDSVAKSLPFTFTFYGKAQSVAFVNSDGNITFGEADRASSERNIARLLEGAPASRRFWPISIPRPAAPSSCAPAPMR